MKIRFPDAQPKRVRAVSSPGGPARQYRVQYQHPGSSLWQVYGCYRQRQEAEQVVAALHERGLLARWIDYRLPAAA